MKTFKRICAIDAIYPLFLYLLLCKDSEEIDDETFYVFGSHIPSSVVNQFKYYYQIHNNKWYMRHWTIQWIALRLIKLLRLPSMRGNVELYANDHLNWSATIIGRKTYSLLEDSPNVSTRYWGSHRMEELQRYMHYPLYKLKRLLLGSTLFKHNGYNRQCKAIVISEPSHVEYTQNKEHVLLSLNNNLWNSYSETKKETILNKFSITFSEVEQLKRFDTILLTRPLWPDDLSLNEHKKIYKHIISQYNISHILVKPHPRDTYPYENDFPGIYVFHKPVPMQLIDMLGCKFKVAVSTFSSAASQFHYPLEIHWYGSEIHYELVKKHGHVQPPKGALTKTLNIK